MKILVKFLTLILLTALWVTPEVQAQESGTIQATATVVSGLNVVGSHNLIFGTVTPGVNKPIDKGTVGSAGEWSISGNAGAEVTLDFTLPLSLYTGDSTGIMPIVFSSTDASYDNTGGGQTAPTGTINPNAISTQNLAGDGTMLIWIGGMVQPSISQTGGNYASDIILTVAYTGS